MFSLEGELFFQDLKDSTECRSTSLRRDRASLTAPPPQDYLLALGIVLLYMSGPSFVGC